MDPTNPTTIVTIKRSKDKIIQDCDIYIGGNLHVGGWNLERSKWANPFTSPRDGTREEVLIKYRRYLLASPELLKDIEELRGKVLGCFCAPPLPCHGNILVELLNKNTRK